MALRIGQGRTSLARMQPGSHLLPASCQDKPCKNQSQFERCRSVDHHEWGFFDKYRATDFVGSSAKNAIQDPISGLQNERLVPIDRACIAVDVVIEFVKLQAGGAGPQPFGSQFLDSVGKDTGFLTKYPYPPNRRIESQRVAARRRPLGVLRIQ